MLGDFMEKIRPSFYFYHGSLTSPLCNETASWLVVEDIQTCTAAQVAALTTKVNDNYRRVQPLYNRTVYIAQTVESVVKWGSFQLISALTAGGVVFLMILNCIQLACKRSSRVKSDALLSR